MQFMGAINHLADQIKNGTMIFEDCEVNFWEAFVGSRYDDSNIWLTLPKGGLVFAMDEPIQLCMYADAKQGLRCDAPNGIWAIYVIRYTINGDNQFSIVDAGLVFKQRMTATRHAVHLAATAQSLQYTMQCVTKEIHANKQDPASPAMALESTDSSGHVQAETPHVRAENAWGNMDQWEDFYRPTRAQ